MSKKKFLCALLTVLMVFSMLPVSSLAATVAGTTGTGLTAHTVVTNGTTVTAGTTATGTVTGSKTAVALSAANEFKVTLTAQGSSVTTTTPGADIVLVLDISGSMGSGFGSDYNDCMSEMIAAAKNFVNTMLATGSQNRISLVTFSETASDATDFYSASNKGTLVSDINDLREGGGTNTQAALYKARQKLAESKSANKFIVIMSDGTPTFNIPTTLSGFTSSYKTAVQNDYGDKVTFDYNKVSSAEGKGDSATYTKKFGGRDGFNVTLSSVYAAIYEAGLAKAAGQNIYSIGLAVSKNTTAQNTLKSISSGNGYYYDSPSKDKLQEVFGQIGQSITSSTTAAGVTDPVYTAGTGTTQLQVRLTGDTLQMATSNALTDGNCYATSGTVTYIDGVLNWVPESISDTATLTYKVKVDVEAAEYNPKNYIPTNGPTTLNYTDVAGESQTLTYDVPTVQAVYGTVKVVGVRVNDKGEYIKADGTVTTDPAQAQVVVNSANVLNANGKIYFNPDQTLTVAAPAAPTGYELKDAATQSVTLAYSSNASSYNKIVYFGYLPETGTISLHKKGYEGNSTVNVSGAVFGIFATEDAAKTGNKEDAAATMTTNEGGVAKSAALAAGTYYVRELSAPEGYLVDDTVYPVTVTKGNDSTLNAGGHVLAGTNGVNEFVNIKTTSFTATKIWAGDSGDLSLRPAAITLTITGTITGNADKKGENVTFTQTLTAANADSTNANQWSATFTNLPKTDVYGNVYTYAITSEGAVNNDTKLNNYSGTINEDGTALTNTLKNNGTITGTKTEADGETALAGATFTLYKKVIEGDTWWDAVKNAVLKI